MRQVTHALLTRPPLSRQRYQSEEINPRRFVRLACVKHAASVHPEPGSNSHVWVLTWRSSFELSQNQHPATWWGPFEPSGADVSALSILTEWQLAVIFPFFYCLECLSAPFVFSQSCYAATKLENTSLSGQVTTFTLDSSVQTHQVFTVKNFRDCFIV